MSRVAATLDKVKAADVSAKRGPGRPKKTDVGPQSLPETVEMMTHALGIDIDTKKKEIIDDSVLDHFNERFGLPRKGGAPRAAATPQPTPSRTAPSKPTLPKNAKQEEKDQAHADWRKRMCLRKGIKIALHEWPHLASFFAMPPVDAPLSTYARVMAEIKMEISTVNEPEMIRSGCCTLAEYAEQYAPQFGVNLSYPVSLTEVVRETVEVDSEGRSAVAEIALDWAGTFDGNPLLRLGGALMRSIKKVATKNAVHAMTSAAAPDASAERARLAALAREKSTEQMPTE
jgi:hypothetical protein